MIRVLAFASALALAVGAIAPAAFADDFVPAQIPLTDLYADPELYDLYVAPYYNNLSFSDWGDYATDAVISGFPMDVVKQVETTEGGLESLWNTVHNAFQFGYNIGQDWVSKLYVDTSDGRLKSDGSIMTDDLKALLDEYFKSTAGSGDVTVGSGTWTYIPANTNSSWIRANAGHNIAYGNLTSHDVWIGRYLSNGNSWGTVVCSYTSGGTVRLYYNSLGSYDNFTSWSTYGTGKYYISRAIFDSNISNNHPYYSSLSAALSDFFDNNPSAPSGSWNGDGYYRDDYYVDIALPAIPSIDWEDLNNKYYIEYGGDFVDGDVNNFYYDLSYNYFPAEYTYTIPYWLIDGNTSVLDFDYSLELPSVELYELPSEFDGGEEVWDASFTMLGGFGAFILLGFSFGLVALFFKD